jgi:organic radical activating enzyme
MDKSLFLSDDFVFYTLEGEGKWIGYPSVFMRLSMCNLTCIGFKSEAAPYGCDSYVSWSKKNKLTFEEIAQLFEKNGYHEKLREGAILKLTGGEPFIQQKNLLDFCKFIHARWGFSDYDKIIEASQDSDSVSELEKPSLYIDFETNGTIMPDEEWLESGKWITTFTTSPKLSNNGDAEEKRYKVDVLRYLAENEACFKFVAKQESDLNEIFEKYINNPEIGLTRSNVWIMPMCGSRKELVEVGPVVADLCKKHSLKFSNRLHLQIWDLALRV